MALNQHTDTPFPLTSLIIRQARKSDLPELEWDGEYWKFRRMFAELYRNSLFGQTLLWLVLTPDNALIGQAFVMLRSGEPDAADGSTRAYVFSFRVKEGWRNRGIGSHLMQFIEDDLRKRGFQFVTLNVAKENLGALRLYQRLGYEISSSRPGVWSYQDPDGIVHRVIEPSWQMIKSLSKKR
jgi:ribosomal protein S18 acetylase RimI-like enzyme